MAACRSMFSLEMIRVLLDRNQIAYKLSAPSADAAGQNPVNRAAAKAGPSIVAMVDNFSELPKELQDYLLTTGNVSSSSPDRAKSLILGGKQGTSGA